MTEATLTWIRELKFAARSLSRTKWLTVTVVLTLALGIGANRKLQLTTPSQNCFGHSNPPIFTENSIKLRTHSRRR